MIRLIAAMDTQRGIATASGIPWNLPGDAAYFRDQTNSGLIVMGWATYLEFAAPLHHRDNYVLTHDGTESLRQGFLPVRDLDDLRARHANEDVWVIGGAAVYAKTIRQADELFITQVLADFHCTKFFPLYQGPFTLTSESEDHQDGEVRYRFQTWRSAR
jgi:dihydrofolate reductase